MTLSKQLFFFFLLPLLVMSSVHISKKSALFSLLSKSLTASIKFPLLSPLYMYISLGSVKEKKKKREKKKVFAEEVYQRFV